MAELEEDIANKFQNKARRFGFVGSRFFGDGWGSGTWAWA